MSNIKSTGNWKSANSSSSNGHSKITWIGDCLTLQSLPVSVWAEGEKKKRGSESHITSHYSEKVKWSAKASNIIHHHPNKSRVPSARLYSATRTEIVSELLPGSILYFFTTKEVPLDAVSMFHSLTVRAFDLSAVRIYGMADCNPVIIENR